MMKNILLSGFYISGFEYFMIFAFIFGGFCLFVSIIHFFIIKKTAWYRNSERKNKTVFFTFISVVLAILVLCLWIAMAALWSSF